MATPLEAGDRETKTREGALCDVRKIISVQRGIGFERGHQQLHRVTHVLGGRFVGEQHGHSATSFDAITAINDKPAVVGTPVQS